MFKKFLCFAFVCLMMFACISFVQQDVGADGTWRTNYQVYNPTINTYTVTTNQSHDAAIAYFDGKWSSPIDVFATSTPTATPTPISDGLISHYRLENNGNDEKGTNNMTAYNSPTYTTGQEGSYAISLDGTNQYIKDDTFTGFPAAGQPFSISAWVKPENSCTEWKSVMHVGDKNASKFVEFRAVSSKFRALIFDGSTNYQVYADSNYTIDTWYHLVMVYDGSELKFWVNKTVQNSGNGVAPTVNYGSSLRFDIGRCYEQRSTALYFPGSIDDVKIFNKALDQTEISGLY